MLIPPGLSADAATFVRWAGSTSGSTSISGSGSPLRLRGTVADRPLPRPRRALRGALRARRLRGSHVEAARRAIILVGVTRVSDSCGYGVPLMSYEGRCLGREEDPRRRRRGDRGLRAQMNSRASTAGRPSSAISIPQLAFDTTGCRKSDALAGALGLRAPRRPGAASTPPPRGRLAPLPRSAAARCGRRSRGRSRRGCGRGPCRAGLSPASGSR